LVNKNSCPGCFESGVSAKAVAGRNGTMQRLVFNGCTKFYDMLYGSFLRVDRNMALQYKREGHIYSGRKEEWRC